MASVQLCRFYPQWDNTPTEIPNPIRGAIVATWSAGHLQSSKQSPKKDFPRLRELAPGVRGSHDAGSRNPGLAFLRDSVHGQKYASSWAQRRSNRDKKCSPSSDHWRNPSDRQILAVSSLDVNHLSSPPPPFIQKSPLGWNLISSRRLWTSNMLETRLPKEANSYGGSMMHTSYLSMVSV